jgi:hypothetical protein
MKKNDVINISKLNGKKIGLILLFALIGWTICGMIMGIGLATTTEANAIIIHALFVPVVFFSIAFIYFRRFNYTTPLQTSLIFITFVILMDFFVVSLIINKNFDMFKSFLGTWFVFMEIFIVTYLTGDVKKVKSWSLGRTSPVLQSN